MESSKSRENRNRVIEEQERRIKALEQEKEALKEALMAAEEANNECHYGYDIYRIITY